MLPMVRLLIPRRVRMHNRTSSSCRWGYCSRILAKRLLSMALSVRSISLHSPWVRVIRESPDWLSLLIASERSMIWFCRKVTTSFAWCSSVFWCAVSRWSCCFSSSRMTSSFCSFDFSNSCSWRCARIRYRTIITIATMTISDAMMAIRSVRRYICEWYSSCWFSISWRSVSW